ncbi:NADP-dependent oxidoreductase [Kushneria pakistanensis]|uniref:NADP-dependent oxidoreductase n=1 Tax=Kushneria pakistanensis TaxID=1508770 RepID=A0ABQ3FDG5_9GAMM|nr:NADP-dependent oxidoreductase [Kushneria pakistanensis]GHC19636.1 NADP-dependent oxidoreductase [Kushneria pakistanensis]
MTQSRYFTIGEHPEGLPERSLFQLESRELPELKDGEVRIRNHWLSVDPYMRGRMSGVKTYVEPFELNQPMEGGALGEIIESRHKDLKEGDRVVHMGGWRDVAQLDGSQVQPLPDIDVPPQAFLGVLGMPGMTAWAGLTLVAELEASDTVLISAASGAVGSLAAQLAHQKGCTVIGSAGSQEKREWLEARGIKAIDHHQDADAIKKALKEAAPQGVDVYYENVGGPMLEAALDAMNDFGRIAVCGMISRYNESAPSAGPANIAAVLTKRLRMQGFIVHEWVKGHEQEFYQQVGPLVADGSIEYRETVEEGLERTPDAFLALFEGSNQGKMLVRLD